MRKQRPGSTRIGSEVTSAEFRVDVFRTARFDKSPAKLQVIVVTQSLLPNEYLIA